MAKADRHDSPERALRTNGTFRIVHALFVRTSNDTLRQDDRLRPVILHEFQNFAADGEIRAHKCASAIQRVGDWTSLDESVALPH